MQLYVLTQNIPYLLKIGVPPETAQEVLDYVMTFQGKDRQIVMRHLNKNPTMSLEELKQFKVLGAEEKKAGFSPEVIALSEKLKIRPETVDWALKKNISPKVIEWAVSINPKFVEWLCKMVLNESIATIAGEDDPVIKTVLKKFDMLRRKPDTPQEYKDINYYKTFNELSDTIATLMVEDPNAEPEMLEGDPHIIHDDGNLQIIKFEGMGDVDILTKMGVQSNGVTWCVGTFGAATYLRYGGPLYMGIQNKWRQFLTCYVAAYGSQIKNRSNETLRDFGVINTFQPILEKLGIQPPDRTSGDNKTYYGLLDLGKEVRATIENTADKGAALAALQAKKENGGGFDARDNQNQPDRLVFGSGIRQQHVLSYLNDSDFADPSIQAYGLQIYNNWIKDVTDFVEFERLYKKLSFGLRMVPEIRKHNLEEFTHFLNEKGSNAAVAGWMHEDAGEDIYMAAGREIKVYAEFQGAYQALWEAKVKSNPDLFKSDKMPKKFKAKFQMLHVQAIIDKIAEGPTDGNGSFKVYNDCAPEVKKMPEVQAAYIKGWKNFAFRFPKDFERIMPANFKTEPEFIEQNTLGWLQYLETVKATRKMDLKLTATIPQRVKDRPEYKEFEKTIVIPSYVTYIKKNVHGYDVVPEEIRKNILFQQSVEKMAIDLMSKVKDDAALDNTAYMALSTNIRRLPRVNKVEKEVNIPLWAALIKNGNTKIFNRLPADIRADPRIISAEKPGWIAAINNATTPSAIIDVFKRMPPQLAQAAEIIALQSRIIPIFMAAIQANPDFIDRVPESMRQNPDFIKAYKNYIVRFLRNLPARSINDYPNLIIPQIANDPTVQKELARGVVAGSWYNLFKLTKLNPTYKKIVAQEIEYHEPGKTDEEQDAVANTYFSIGHGDDDDIDTGTEGFPSYYVWRYWNNDIQTYLVNSPKREKTHGHLWGHDNTGFKGRYEIGRKYLTLVRDSPLNSKREVPEFILILLKRQFPKVEKIFIF